MKTGVKVLDAMTKKPVVVEPNESIKNCAKIMLDQGVGGVVVRKDHVLQGIVTEKDIVEKAVAKELNLKKAKVKDIMTKNPITIEPDKDIYEALTKMRDKEVRRLPVVRKRRLIGILTEKDVLKIEPQLFDLIVEKLQIREASYKPSTKERYIEGECDNCGNYAQLYGVAGKLVCEECRDELR